MKTRAIPRLLTVAVALAIAAIAAAHAHAQANTNVWIRALAIDGTTLTITGNNFGSAPAVYIGDAALTVSNSSNTQILAATPQLEPGMHVVKVVRDANDGGSATSTLLVR